MKETLLRKYIVPATIPVLPVILVALAFRSLRFSGRSGFPVVPAIPSNQGRCSCFEKKKLKKAHKQFGAHRLST
jgi:hypothetical protein